MKTSCTPHIAYLTSRVALRRLAGILFGASLFCLSFSLRAADTGWKSPSATGEDFNQWTSGSEGLSSNDTYASETTDAQSQDFYNFSFGIPAGAIIHGIEVKTEANCNTCDGDDASSMLISLSTNSGANFTVTQEAFHSGLTDTFMTVGNPTNLWNWAWTDSQLNNANFRLKAEADLCSGCASLLEGSLLMDAEGIYRPIEDFRVGDGVFSFDTNSALFSTNTIVRLTAYPTSEVYFVNGEIRVTGSELIYANQLGNGEFKWIYVRDLAVGDTVLRERGREVSPTRVEAIEKISGSFTVYDLDTALPFNNYWVDHYLLDPPVIRLDHVQVKVYHSGLIEGADWGGADLIPGDGDVLKGTFTNVGTFRVNSGVTVYSSAPYTLAIYASSITIVGVLDGTARGYSGGNGGSGGSGGGIGGSGGTHGGGTGGQGGNWSEGDGGGGGGGGGGYGGNGSSGGAGGAGNVGGTGGSGGTAGTADTTLHGTTAGYDFDAGAGGGGGGQGGNQQNAGGNGSPGVFGGPGGSGVMLFSSGTVTVSGKILADGGSGGTGGTGGEDFCGGNEPGGGGGGGGGGSGGGVLIDSLGYMVISGTISADGGAGGTGGAGGALTEGFCTPMDWAPAGSDGGVGGGGRIKLFYPTNGTVAGSSITVDGANLGTINYNLKPSTPTLASPADLSGEGATPTLDWNASTDSDGPDNDANSGDGTAQGSLLYRLEVSNNANFSTIYFSSEPSAGITVYAATFNFTNGTYYWRVRAKDDTTWTTWSSTRSFDVSATGSSYPSFAYEDFESGLSSWTLQSPWSSATVPHTGSYSLTDSPAGDYSNNLNIWAAFKTTFSVTSDTKLKFHHKYITESCCDHGYVEISTYIGGAFLQIGNFVGENALWPMGFNEATINLGALYAGATAQLRFRFTSDTNEIRDGWYIDDVVVEQDIITVSDVPGYTIGQAYSQTLSPQGGTGPYTFTFLNGSLPAGLSIDSAGNITGTPTSGGVMSFLVKVEDSAGVANIEKVRFVFSSFTEGFETGLSSWTYQGSWSTTTVPNTGAYSFTDSPSGDYVDNLDISAVSKTHFLISATTKLKFSHKYEIETGCACDFAYLDISTYTGGAFFNLATYDGTNASWPSFDQTAFNLGPLYAGGTAQLSLRLTSDTGAVFDGWYIDDIVVSSYIPPTSSAVSAVNISSIAITWGAVASDGYVLEASTGAFPNSFSGNKSSSTTVGTRTSISVLNLAVNTTYYLRAGAIWGSTTDYALLNTTATLAVRPATPVGISTFTDVTSSGFTVNWSSGTSGGGYNPPGTEYQVERSTSSNFDGTDDVTSSTQPAAAPAITFTNLTADTGYFIQVRAVNHSNLSTAWINFGSTTTDAGENISPVSYIAPISDTWTNNPRPSFNWNATAIPDLDYYLFELDDDINFGSVNISSATDLQVFKATSNYSAGTYYWRVRVKDTGGNWSSGEPVWPLNTDYTSPGNWDISSKNNSGVWINTNTVNNDMTPDIRTRLQDTQSGLITGQSAASISSGTVLLLHLDENAGTTTYDSSGHGNNGTIVDPGQTSEWTTGMFNSGILLESGWEYITIPNSDSIDFSGNVPMTLSLWLKPNNTVTDYCLFGKWYDDTMALPYYHYGVEQMGGGDLRFFNATGASSYASYGISGSVDIGNWGLYTFVTDGTSWQWYKNGLLINSGNDAISFIARGKPLWIGADRNEQQHYEGLIDDFLILNRALSAEEVAAMYNSASIKYSSNSWTNSEIITSTDTVLTSGSDGSLSLETSTATAVPFNKSSLTNNQIKFLARDLAGNVAESSAYTIQIGTVPPVDYIAPSSQTWTNEPRPSFNWVASGIGNLDYYLFELDDDINFGSVNISSATDLTVFRATANVVAGTYYWRVRVKDTGGVWSGGDPVWSINLDFTAPAYSNLASKNNGGVWIDTNTVNNDMSPDVKITVQDGDSGIAPELTDISLSSGTSFLMHFDPADTNKRYDMSGKGNHGTYYGNTLRSTTPGWRRSGASEGALYFDGTGDYISLGDLDAPGDFTLGYWMKPTLLDASWRSIIMKSYDYGMEMNNGLVSAQVNMSSMAEWDGPDAQVTVNQWAQIVMTWDNSNKIVSMYKNGILVGQNNWSSYSRTTNNNNMLFGSYDGSGEYFQGWLDEPFLVQRLMSPAEIAANYNTSSIKYTTNSWTNTGIITSTTSVLTSGTNGSTSIETSTAVAVPFNKSSLTANQIEFLARDRAGNIAESSPYTIQIDTNAQIYRSVAPGKDTALETGGSNALTILGTAAEFASDLPLNVGVGDAIQYDSDGNTSIDKICFIRGRTDARHFTVATASGTTPTPVSGDTDWSIFRAYTSLYNAERGNENDGIDNTVEDFDNWDGAGDYTDTDEVGRDLVSNSEIWNIACYANGTTADTTAVVMAGWGTGPNNYLRVFTPVSADEVGESQRHGGKWDTTKYRIEDGNTANTSVIDVTIGHSRIEGLQIYNSSTTASTDYIVYFNEATDLVATDYRLFNNILRGTTTATALLYGVRVSGTGGAAGSVLRAKNNIIYDIGTGNYRGFGLGDPDYTYYLYNNTVHNIAGGVAYQVSGGNCIAKNNIAQDSASGFGGTFNAASTDNLSDQADAPGSSQHNSKTVLFLDEAGDDFHLAAGDTVAKDTATALSGDTYLAFADDIDGQTRPQGTLWDIGADEQTAVALGTPGSPAIQNVYVSSINASWALVTSATGYTLVASTVSTNPPAPSDIRASSTTAGNTATAATVYHNPYALDPNTTYYLFVRANGNAQSGSYAVFLPTATLAVPPATPVGVSTFTSVTSLGFTVNWSSGAVLMGWNPAGTMYQVERSTSSNFDGAGDVTTSTEPAGVPAIQFTGLSSNTQYFVQVRAVNRNNIVTGWVNFGSTTTVVETVQAIYRSVAPGKTSAVATSGGNSLTIQGTAAEFSSDLPANVGVGDAIQYDSDGNTNIDKICFIHGRTDARHYTVATVSGTTPVPVSGDTDWSVFRAYSSLLDAENGAENSGIDANVRAFESWSGGRDIDGNNEVWNIACYANGTTADTGDFAFNGWTTSADNYLQVFTPAQPSEVGISQRHKGKWDTTSYFFEKGSLESADGAIDFAGNVAHARVEGLQIYRSSCSASSGNHAVRFAPAATVAADFRAFDNIFRGTTTAVGAHNAIRIGAGGAGSVLKAKNNIAYDFSGNTNAAGIDVQDADYTAYLYNNTVQNANKGYRIVAGVAGIAKNNIAQDCVTGYTGSYDASSVDNLSSLTDAPGSSPHNSKTVFFLDKAGDDFRLAANDAVAKDTATTLSGDTYLAFSDDIDGQSRPIGTKWDIGADEASGLTTAIYGSSVTVDNGTNKWVVKDSIFWLPNEWYHKNVGSGTDNLLPGPLCGASTCEGIMVGVETRLMTTSSLTVPINTSGLVRIQKVNSSTATLHIWPSGRLYLTYKINSDMSGTGDYKEFAVHRPAAGAPQVSNVAASSRTVVISDTSNNNYAGVAFIPSKNTAFYNVSTQFEDDNFDQHYWGDNDGDTMLAGSHFMLIDPTNYRATTATRDDAAIDYRFPNGTWQVGTASTTDPLDGNSDGFAEGIGAYIGDASGNRAVVTINNSSNSVTGINRYGVRLKLVNWTTSMPPLVYRSSSTEDSPVGRLLYEGSDYSWSYHPSSNAAYFEYFDTVDASTNTRTFKFNPLVLQAPTISSISNVYPSSMTATWNLATGATGYTLVASTVSTNPPATSDVWASSTTVGNSATSATVYQSGLEPNTTYYLFVRANGPEQSSGYTAYSATSTRAVPPSTPVGVSTFTGVTSSGFTVNWSSGTSSGGYNPSGTTYQVERSTSSNFDGSSDVTTSTQPVGSPSITLTGLTEDTTYYIQVRTMNWNSVPTGFVNFGSTKTLVSAGGGCGTLAVNGTPTASVKTGGTSWTLSHNSPSGTNTMLLVSVTLTNDLTYDVSGITYAGQPMTYLGSVDNTDDANVDIYYKLSPPTGANDVVVSFTGTVGDGTVGAVSFQGVNQATPFGDFGSAIGDVDPITITTHSASGELVFDTVSAEYATAITADASQTVLWNLDDGSGNAGASTKPGAANVTMSWTPTVTLPHAAITAVPIKPCTGNIPVPGNLTHTGVHISSISASWGLVTGATGYTLVASTVSTNPPATSDIQASSTTLGGSATAASAYHNPYALNPNTTYYLFVRANGDSESSQYGAFAATATLAVAPVSPVGVSTFTNVGVSSFTVNWTSGTVSTGYNPAGTLYEVERSTSSGFNGTGDVTTSTRPAGSPSITMTGLAAETTYYIQIRAVNHRNLPTSYVNFGSTKTSVSTEGGGSIGPLEASATGNTTFNATAYTEMDSMSLTPGTAGDYLVVFSGSVSGPATAGNEYLYVSIFVNGVQVAHTERQFQADSSFDTLTFYPIATHASVSVGAGQTIDVRWKSSAAATWTAKQRTLDVIPVSSAKVSQATDTADATTASATDVLLTGMTATPGAGDYLALFTTSAEGPDTSQPTFTIYVNGTALAHTQRTVGQETSVFPAALPVFIAARVSPGAGEAVEVRWSNTGTAGTITDHERTFTLYKTDNLNIFQTSATADSAVTNNTDALLNTMTLTPGAGKYLALFSNSHRYGTISANKDTYSSLYVNNSQLAHTERTSTQEESIDNSDNGTMTNGIVEPGSSQAVELRWRGGDTTSRTSHERTLALIRVALLPPENPAFTGVYTTSITANWSLTAGASGYYLVASTKSATPPVDIWSSSTTVGNSATTASVYQNTALSPNTTYYLFVQANGPDMKSNFALFPATCTRAAVPSPIAFTGTDVGITSVTFHWTSNNNPANTTFQAVVSTSSTDFYPVLATHTFSTSESSTQTIFTGLTHDLTHYFRVRAINHSNVATEWSTVISTLPKARAIYYSVGTNTDDLKVASNLTILDGLATFTAGQANNVGVGDKVDYSSSKIAYIARRIDPTHYELQTATGGLPGNESTEVAVNSIQRTFNLLSTAEVQSAWATYLNTTDLVNANVQLHWACYNDAPLDDTVEIEGWTTGPNNYIRVFAPTQIEAGIPQSHSGRAGTGFRMKPIISSPPNNLNILLTAEEYTRFEGLELDGSNVTNGNNVTGLTVWNAGPLGPSDIYISRCIIHDIRNSNDDAATHWASGISVNDGAVKVSNCLIYDIENLNEDGGSYAGGVFFDSDGSYFFNNTIFRISDTAAGNWAYGLWQNAGGLTAKNNYVGDIYSAGVKTCYVSVPTQNNNVSSDDTATGQIDKNLYSDYFVNINDGSEDLRLRNNSNTLWGSYGEDLDQNAILSVIDDINGDARDSSQPDIGADENVAGTIIGTPTNLQFTAVNISSITASWSLITSATGYTLLASTVSTNPPATDDIWASSTTIGNSVNTAAVYHAPSALNPNTTYYLFVRANASGQSSSYTASPATATMAALPATRIDTSTFTEVLYSSFTVNWSSGTTTTGYNPSGTTYRVERSTSSDFDGSGDVTTSTQPAGAPAVTLESLTSDTTYYIQISAVNHNAMETVCVYFGSTRTLENTPPAGTTITGVQSGAPNSVALTWTTPGDDGSLNTLPVGSEYRIQYTTDATTVEWSTTNAQVIISTNGVAPGVFVSTTLYNLEPSTQTFYFRIWTRDEVPNWSGISNGATCFVTPFSFTTVDGSASGENSITLDSAGYPHISYYASNDLKHAEWDGAVWSTEIADGASAVNVGAANSIAIDAAGNIHIAYRDVTNTALKYSSWTGTGWHTPTIIDGAGADDVGGNLSIGLDGGGYPHIAYYDGTVANQNVKYARWTGTKWSTDTVTTAGNVGAYLSLVVDSTGNAHIAYTDTTAGEVKYTRWNGSDWETPETVATTNPNYVSLALDGNGIPHISHGGPRYASKTGGTWSDAIFDANAQTTFTDITLDGNGRPHIAYFDSISTNQNMKYARWTGTAWSTHTIDSRLDIGREPSIAIDGSGNVHISYRDNTNGELKYSSWTGTGFAGAMGGRNATGRPQAPSDLVADSVHYTSVTWSWNDNASTGLGFRLFSATSQAGPYTMVAGTDTIAASPYTQTGLRSNTTYYAYLVAVNTGGHVFSNLASTHTAQNVYSVNIIDLSYPYDSMDLAASSITASGITVNNDSFDFETFSIRADTVTAGSPWFISSDGVIDQPNEFGLRALFHTSRPDDTNFNPAGTEDLITGDYQLSQTVGGGGRYTVDGSTTGVNVPVGQSRQIWFRLTMPSISSTTAAPSIRVYIKGSD